MGHTVGRKINDIVLCLFVCWLVGWLVGFVTSFHHRELTKYVLFVFSPLLNKIIKRKTDGRNKLHCLFVGFATSFPYTLTKNNAVQKLVVIVRKSNVQFK